MNGVHSRHRDWNNCWKIWELSRRRLTRTAGMGKGYHVFVVDRRRKGRGTYNLNSCSKPICEVDTWQVMGKLWLLNRMEWTSCIFSWIWLVSSSVAIETYVFFFPKRQGTHTWCSIWFYFLLRTYVCILSAKLGLFLAIFQQTYI